MSRAHWGPCRSSAISLHYLLLMWHAAPAMARKDKVLSAYILVFSCKGPWAFAQSQPAPIQDPQGSSFWPKRSVLAFVLAKGPSSECWIIIIQLLPIAGCLLPLAGTCHLILESHLYGGDLSEPGEDSLLLCPCQQDGGIFSLVFGKNSHSLSDARLK